MFSDMNIELFDKAKEDERNLHPYIVIEHLKPINTDIYYVQDWFSKASWTNKLNFCTRLFNIIKDGVHVIDLVYFIGSPGKDLVYGREQINKSSYDVQPLDHNRSLSDEHLSKIKRYYINWFKSLPNYQQIQVFTSLLHIGGSALQEKIYNMGVNVLSEREEMITIQLENEKKLEENRKLLMKIENKLISKHKRKKQKPKNKIKEKQLVADPKFSQKDSKVLSKNSSESQILTLEGLIKSGRLTEVLLGPRSDTRAKFELARLQQQWAKISSKVETSSIKTQNTSYPDRIQMLPIWVNRKIINQLPDFSHQLLSKVNGYWKDMVANIKKERKARKTINFATLSIESSAPVYRTHFAEMCKDEVKNVKKIKPSTKRQSQSQPVKLEKKKNPSKIVRNSTAVPNLSVMVETEPKRSKFVEYYSTFEKNCNFSLDKYTLSMISNEYALNRVGVASPRWIVTANENNLKFHCTRTGAPSTIEIIECHFEPITCIALHPNNYQVFTASYDGKIKLFDIWSKECKLTYFGHKNLIISIAANDSYVVSCSGDSLLKIFRIQSAVCILTLELQEGLPTKICVNEENDVYVGNVNGKLVMVRFYDTGVILLEKNITYGLVSHAHLGEITCLSTYPLFVISGGIDGFVRIWDGDFIDSHWIGSFKHKTRVNSAIMSFLKLFTICEDGNLFMWNISECSIIRQININSNGRPILNMCCLEERYFVKFVLFSEMDIKLLEFELPWKKSEAKKRPKFSAAKSIEHTKRLKNMNEKVTKGDIQMMKLHYRSAILENLRDFPLVKRVEEQRPTIFSTAVEELNEIRSFPRIYKTEKPRKPVGKRYYKPLVTINEDPLVIKQ